MERRCLYSPGNIERGEGVCIRQVIQSGEKVSVFYRLFRAERMFQNSPGNIERREGVCIPQVI